MARQLMGEVQILVETGVLLNIGGPRSESRHLVTCGIHVDLYTNKQEAEVLDYQMLRMHEIRVYIRQESRKKFPCHQRKSLIFTPAHPHSPSASNYDSRKS